MSIKEVVEHFRKLEQQFWANMDEETLDYATYEGEGKPEEMLFYGEFAFTLLGLKPNLLFDFRDPKTNGMFHDIVIQPTLRKFKIKKFKPHNIWDIRTQDRKLDGCCLLYDESQPIEEVDQLLSSPGGSRRITNRILALILSYPGTLPATQAEYAHMKSVVYLEQRPDGTLVTLTTFAIQEHQIPNMLEHFRIHALECREKLDMDLKLEVK